MGRPWERVGSAVVVTAAGGLGELPVVARAQGDGNLAPAEMAGVTGKALIGTVDLTGRTASEEGPAGRGVGIGNVTLRKQVRVEKLGVVRSRARKVARGDGRQSPVAVDTVLLPMEARGGEMLDLTVGEVAVRRHRKGRWSAIAD